MLVGVVSRDCSIAAASPRHELGNVAAASSVSRQVPTEVVQLAFAVATSARTAAALAVATSACTAAVAVVAAASAAVSPALAPAAAAPR